MAKSKVSSAAKAEDHGHAALEAEVVSLKKEVTALKSRLTRMSKDQQKPKQIEHNHKELELSIQDLKGQLEVLLQKEQQLTDPRVDKIIAIFSTTNLNANSLKTKISRIK